MSIFQAIILAIVEGITEFMPISSTGHMIIASAMMGINEQEFTKIFTVNIQFGAILSVVALYWKKFFQSINFYIKLFIAFIPAAIAGLLFGDAIDELLENVVVVAVNLLLGGVVLIFIDKWFGKKVEPAKVVRAGDANADVLDAPAITPSGLIDDEKRISYWQAFKIGAFQCIALLPGVSRSAATIIGGMTQRMTRKAAAEFSFFLAVPTMFAASAYKLTKDYEHITSDSIQTLVIGNVVAFVVAILAIRFFITFLTRYGFWLFGWYRIILGLLILVLFALGYDMEV